MTRKAIAEKDMDLTPEQLAELQRKAHAYDSEQGRLRKIQEDLDAERARRAELEANLGKTQAAQIDPRAAEIFGADGMSILQTMLSPVMSKLDTIGKKFEERDGAEAKLLAERGYRKALDSKLSGNNLPGFAARLFDGDLAPTWANFMESHPVIRRAQEAGDVETVSEMVGIFIHQNKELVAGGGYSPQALGGSPLVKSEYSDSDYHRDVAVLKRQMENVQLTEKEFNQKADALYERWVAAQEKAQQTTHAFGLA